MNKMHLTKEFQSNGHQSNGAVEQKKWVLIMDDSPLILKNLSITMQHLGYAVIEASEGEEAILKAGHLMESFSISIAILDLCVNSGMDGVATAVRLREMDSSLKIIISTGSLRPEFKEKLGGVQIDGILLKPYSLEELRKVLESLETEVGELPDYEAGDGNG